jgi:hypothetical protein
MYAPFNDKSGVGVATARADIMTTTTGADGVDGVSFFDPNVDGGQSGAGTELVLPERLRAWLLDLCLLRHIPLAYMVPDAALLPPESIRFFHVDPTWIDRVVDGVLAAANTGTVDSIFSYRVLFTLRQTLAADLRELAGNFWRPGRDPLTGMLIRSEAVRHWPGMKVRAFSGWSGPPNDSSGTGPLPVLRAEPISRDMFIALFAGDPKRVELAEPFEGVRFGVELKNPADPDGGYVINRRKPDGNSAGGHIDLTTLLNDKRAIDIHALAGSITGHAAPEEAADGNGSSRAVALHLEQRPYVQLFHLTPAVPEGRGSQDWASAERAGNTTLRRGRALSPKSLQRSRE